MYPPYNLTGEGYKNTSIIPAVVNGAYVNDSFMSSDSGWIPLTPCLGSATTYYSSYLYSKIDNIYYLSTSGQFNSAADAIGSRFFAMDQLVTATNAGWGSRISYIKP